MSSAAISTGATSSPRYRILVVDDDPGLLRLIERRLRSHEVATFTATSGTAAIAAVRSTRPDLVLVDFNLPDMRASEMVEQLNGAGIECPFIVITGFGDEQVAVDMMKRGARDYLRKDAALLELLPAVVERTLEQIERERRLSAAEEAFRLLHSAVQQARDAVLITSADLEPPGPHIVLANPAFYALTGYAPDELARASPRLFQGRGTDRVLLQRMRRNLDQGIPWSGELLNYRKDGSQYLVELTITPVRNEAGQVTHFVAIERDITERRRLESQVRQSAKMEAIGSLSGGIAHDFNNMLAVIRGHAELLLQGVEAGHPMHDGLESIRGAAEHATALTRQLLAFSRKNVLQPDIVDLGEIVARTVRLLRRLIGENIHVRVDVAPDVAQVNADANQMEQVTLNLAINARDAMPEGGTLSFALRNLVLGEPGSGDLVGVPPGRYADLTVSDTGVGMDDETLSRVFEPFFTTKGGEGTGLGLATVYGIVRQSDGHVRAYSEPGRGTTFRVLLPEARAVPRVAVPEPRGGSAATGGTETILVAEDEPMVRSLIERCLTDAGYTVISAGDGQQALDKARAEGRPIDVLLTDVMMPGLAGPDLARRLRAERPDVRVMFLSGYTDRALDQQSLEEAGGFFLQKPFTPRALLEQLRTLLDRTA